MNKSAKQPLKIVTKNGDISDKKAQKINDLLENIERLLDKMLVQLQEREKVLDNLKAKVSKPVAA